MAPVGFLETNVIYCDDNLARLSQFPAECVDLIYLDPPFFSNRNYEVIWGDEAEIRSFEDRWAGGINVYVDWMRERVMELHRILKPTGTFYLHCDWHASHYLKVMLDDVFDGHFLNEIVWCYDTGGRAKASFPRKHDIIFRYAKTARPPFYYDQVALPRDFSTMHETVHTDTDGRLYQTNVKNGKEYRYYLDKGVLPNDWWADIPALNPADRERLGYPTQKPEKLLHRIINASTRKGEIVLDPFAGCGTTMVAAHQLGRQWIGIDISPTAVNLMKRRMEKVGAVDVRLVGMPVTEAGLRALKPFEFQNWAIDRINGTHSPRKSGDMGIDGYSWVAHEPVQVKQSEHIGRNVVDNFETAIERDGHKKKGYIIAFSFGKGAYEEAARAKLAKKVDIELIRVADLLDRSHPLTQQAGDIFGNAPLPKRDAATLPSVEDLVGHDPS